MEDNSGEFTAAATWMTEFSLGQTNDVTQHAASFPNFLMKMHQNDDFARFMKIGAFWRLFLK